MTTDPMKVVTGTCRSSYMFCRELVDRTKKKTGNKTVKTSILIPKKDKKTIKAIRKAMEAAAKKKHGAGIKTKSKNFTLALRDGDEELEDETVEGAHYKDHYFLSATAYKLPGVLDKDGARMEDPDELDETLISGYYFKFSLTFKGYDNESKGVRAQLNNIMFVKEGDRLDGGASAEEDFGYDEPDDDDDDDDDDGDDWD